MQDKLAVSLRTFGLNALAVPITVGLPHDLDETEKDLTPSTAFENHLICVYPIYMASMGATELCFDYRRSMFRFLKEGEEVSHAAFASLKQCTTESEQLVTLDEFDHVSMPPSFPEKLKLEDMGVSFDSSIYNISNPEDSQNVDAELLSEQNKVRIDNSSTTVKNPANNFSNFRADVSMESFKHLTLVVNFIGQNPVTFVCPTLLQREDIFRRFQGINSETFRALKASPEKILVLHRGIAKIPGLLFSKSVFLAVVAGRILQYDDCAPEAVIKDSVDLTAAVGSFAVPSGLTHANSCPRAIITLYATEHPIFDAKSGKITLKSFSPTAKSIEYQFEKEDAVKFFEAICFARNVWNYEQYLNFRSKINGLYPKLFVKSSQNSSLEVVGTKTMGIRNARKSRVAFATDKNDPNDVTSDSSDTFYTRFPPPAAPRRIKYSFSRFGPPPPAPSDEADEKDSKKPQSSRPRFSFSRFGPPPSFSENLTLKSPETNKPIFVDSILNSGPPSIVSPPLQLLSSKAPHSVVHHVHAHYFLVNTQIPDGVSISSATTTNINGLSGSNITISVAPEFVSPTKPSSLDQVVLDLKKEIQEMKPVLIEFQRLKKENEDLKKKLSSLEKY